jgi:hypothetical protein
MVTAILIVFVVLLAIGVAAAGASVRRRSSPATTCPPA